MCKLSPAQLRDAFWMKLMEFERYSDIHCKLLQVSSGGVLIIVDMLSIFHTVQCSWHSVDVIKFSHSAASLVEPQARTPMRAHAHWPCLIFGDCSPITEPLFMPSVSPL